MPQFQRAVSRRTQAVHLTVDGRAVTASEGDSVLAAMLLSGDFVRQADFGDGRRAGFCLMGACQDCWVWTEDGGRLRACSTPAAAGMRLCTRPPRVFER